MKIIEKVLENVNTYDEKKLLLRANKKADQMRDALDATLKILEHIRYQDWPTIGLGIDLHPEPMDEAMFEAERALESFRRIS